MAKPHGATAPAGFRAYAAEGTGTWIIDREVLRERMRPYDRLEEVLKRWAARVLMPHPAPGRKHECSSSELALPVTT